MFTLHPPTDRHLLATRLKQAAAPFSYPHLGCTRSTSPPQGYDADRNRVLLGRGAGVFEAAREALRRWVQFPAGWVRVDPPDAPIRVGTVVSVSARVFGVWWANTCRIADVTDDPDRFGFAYGTLPSHVEMGEERFSVERAADGAVWYEILAHSRPRHWLPRLAYPLTRRVQRRFARDSLAAMARALGGMVGGGEG
jgi:uncharacterized protein (UPF0548 family)